MEYSKLTKDQLIELLEKQNQEIENQKHLADAVREKDKEINILKDKNKALVDEKIELQKDQQIKLTEAMRKSDQGAEKRVEERYQEIREQHEKDKKVLADNLSIANKKLLRRESEITKLANAHGDLLKIMEATVNTHLTLNSYIIKDIQKD